MVAGCDSRLHVIDLKSGAEQGSVDIESPTQVTPAVIGDLVFFGTEAGEFFGVDWKQAEIAWRSGGDRGMAFRSSPAATEKLVIVGGRDKQIRRSTRKPAKPNGRGKRAASLTHHPLWPASASMRPAPMGACMAWTWPPATKSGSTKPVAALPVRQPPPEPPGHRQR